MRLVWDRNAWEDYKYWRATDLKILKPLGAAPIRRECTLLGSDRARLDPFAKRHFHGRVGRGLWRHFGVRLNEALSEGQFAAGTHQSLPRVNAVDRPIL